MSQLLIRAFYIHTSFATGVIEHAPVMLRQHGSRLGHHSSAGRVQLHDAEHLRDELSVWLDLLDVIVAQAAAVDGEPRTSFVTLTHHLLPQEYQQWLGVQVLANVAVPHLKQTVRAR